MRRMPVPVHRPQQERQPPMVQHGRLRESSEDRPLPPAPVRRPRAGRIRRPWATRAHLTVGDPDSPARSRHSSLRGLMTALVTHAVRIAVLGEALGGRLAGGRAACSTRPARRWTGPLSSCASASAANRHAIQISSAFTPGSSPKRAFMSRLTTVRPVSAACAAMIRSCAPRAVPERRTWASRRP